MKGLIQLFFLLLISFQSLSQAVGDTIEVRKSFWHGTANYVNGRKISPAETKTLLLSFPESKAEYLKAKKSFLRGALIWTAGAAVAVVAILNKEKDSFVPTIWAGAAIATVSLPFIINSGKHLSKSVRQYNERVRNR